MKGIDIFNEIKIYDRPNFLQEASIMIDDYIKWKNYKNISFYDTSIFVNSEKETKISYLVDRFKNADDYIIFIKEIRKASKVILDEFFDSNNEDVIRLFNIHRFQNENEFSFLLSVLASFGIDKIQKVSKEDFYFQIKIMFMIFVDASKVDEFSYMQTSKSMMEKKLKDIDLLSIMLNSSYTNDQAMDLFKALYKWESLYDRLKVLLIKLETIIEDKFYLIEISYKEKLEKYINSNFEFVYKILQDFGFNDLKIDKKYDARFYLNLLNPYSAAMRSIILNTQNVEIVFGIFIDKHYKQKDDKFSDSSNQEKLKVFSDTTRFEIIKLLQKRPYYVKELADVLYLTPATLSYHLNQLQMAGFIGIYFQGRKSYYYLRKETIEKLADYLNHFAKNIKEGEIYERS